MPSDDESFSASAKPDSWSNDRRESENATKHHCRACGEGFCDSCSNYKMPVPERGWGADPVRVCFGCFNSRKLAKDSRKYSYFVHFLTF